MSQPVFQRAQFASVLLLLRLASAPGVSSPILFPAALTLSASLCTSSATSISSSPVHAALCCLTGVSTSSSLAT